MGHTQHKSKQNIDPSLLFGNLKDKEHQGFKNQHTKFLSDILNQFYGFETFEPPFETFECVP